MSDGSEGTAHGPSHRSVETGVAVLTAVFALIVIFGSIQAGNGWAAEGPQAGFFPFYVGLFILVSSAVNFVYSLMGPRDTLFADWHELGQVMAVVVPTVIYVILIPWTGIYLASMLLIGFFMRWLGKYGWSLIALIAIGTPVIIFVVFEKWFLVPLPKGPIEDMLGF